VKIIFVTACLPHGADEAFVIPEIKQLIQYGHQVLVVPRSRKGRIIHGHELRRLSRMEPLYSRATLKAAVKTVWSAPGGTCRATAPLLKTRSLKLAVKNLAIIPKALWLAEVARNWGADHIHCHWAGTTASMTMLASKLSGVPWSLTAHRWDIVENNLLADKVRSARFARFISEDGLRMARERGVGTAANARVLHMGVSIPSHIQRWYGPRPLVVCPARLVPVKGHRYLLEAWRILRRRGLDPELWLAGGGELRARLEALSESLGLAGSVRFLGAVPHRELLKIYEQLPISAVVLPSIDLGAGEHEGTPVALIEAMSYGIPVIATATGGTAELVTPGSGVLVPPADSEALADAIDRLMHDGNLRAQLGDAGRRRAVEAYDVARIAEELASAFAAGFTQTASHTEVLKQPA
jgi:colanic acid/amylovoran biosynthesis glycosyltransferase